MNVIDACFLGMLALADLSLLIWLRRRHHRTEQTERIMRSLAFVVRRESLSAAAESIQ